MAQIVAKEAPRLLNLKAVAVMLGISPHTLRAWVQQGRVPVVRIGALLLFDRQDLETLIQATKQRWFPHQKLAANARKGHKRRKQRHSTAR